jgi:hypothetical protein
MPDSIRFTSDNRVPRQNPDAVAEFMRDEVMLLHTRTEQYFALNEVGAKLWSLADGRCNVSDILAVLREEYDVDQDELRTDVEELLTELVTNQLLTWADE